jgi:DNA-binding MarR family transcriptional regulator
MANQSSSTSSIVDVADRLHSAAIHMLRYLRRADAATGLSAARASVLSVVVFGGPVTIGDLATAEQVSAPTMTKLITSLEGEGLVRRVVDEQDRRVVRVHATPQAARILRRGRAARVRVLAATLRALNPAELATLGRAADILRTLEEQRRDQPAPRGTRRKR